MIAMNQAFLYSLIVLNIVTFLVYGIDKWKANLADIGSYWWQHRRFVRYESMAS